MSIYVDPDALDKISSIVTDAGAALDAVGGASPTAVDGGDATAALLGILGRMAENVGHLVVDLAVAGAAVQDSSVRYREQDAETADVLDSVWTR